ncbi:hypothetical protein BDA99DRAFT_519672 [Phascolomyces articulosus]|uniref:Uncharacterized protein n=1 Tax=Phascolomyces articulosus TaxID=60185 RepID=A0AAD5JT60_9FUNG|nr:hypothetical protein BDA99DRAFT_519672 [Phascolomyces articulosus]
MPEFNKHSTGPSDAAPQPHRCNGHLEDVLEGVSSWPMDVAKPFSLFLQCIKSQPGQEPVRYSQQKNHSNNNNVTLIVDPNSTS